MNNNDVRDLRIALDFLRTLSGELVEKDVPISPHAELAGVYRHIGAGGTVYNRPNIDIRYRQ